MTKPDLAAVLARLERLETQNRRLKRIVLGVLLLGVVVVLLGAADEPKVKTVETDRLILRDKFGRQRAVLQITGGDADSSPALILYDENERPRVGLGVNKDGPGLYFTDANGKHRAVLSRNNEGIGLDLLDANGKPRAEFRVTDSGAGMLARDEAGNPRFAAGTDKDQRPTLFLYDETGKPRLTLGVDKRGPSLRLLDAKERALFVKP